MSASRLPFGDHGTATRQSQVAYSGSLTRMPAVVMEHVEGDGSDQANQCRMVRRIYLVHPDGHLEHVATLDPLFPIVERYAVGVDPQEVDR